MAEISWESLRAPFPADDIEWRIQQAGVKGEKVWALCLAYVTNRAIQQRLDDVAGPENWCNQYATGPDGGILCGLSLRVGDSWITKWDGAENTATEPVKGGLSGAMKRAAVQWGIGRYLYNLEATFAKVHENGAHKSKVKGNGGKDLWFRWDPPHLPAWALPLPAQAPKAAPPPPPPSPKPMDEGERATMRENLCDSLRESSNADALKVRYTNAYRAAKKAGDEALCEELHALFKKLDDCFQQEAMEK